MYLWELLAISGNLLWALVVTILSLVAGSQLWELMDQRYLESLDHVAGDETPLTWDKAMRNFFISIIAGFAAMISGVSIGYLAEKMISWFDQYDDKTA
jgi:ABC-type Fe3+ transport system permease subunit